MRKLYLLCLSLAVCGCGSGSGTVPVSGVVKLDGQPLKNASVSFVPEGDGKQATGTTDEAGKFALSTVNPRDGAIPGKYKVVIEQSSNFVETADGLSSDQAMAANAAALAKAKKPTGPQVPEAYTRLDKTPLTQEVPPRGEVVFDIKSK